MRVIHVAHGGMSATIYPFAGLAILPQLQVCEFFYANVDGAASPRCSKVLPTLPWDKCVKMEMCGRTGFVITLQAAPNKRSLVYFHISSRESRVQFLQRVGQVQIRWRYRLPIFQYRQKRKAHLQKLEVLAMGLHPRLGANSPMTVETLWMVAGHWLV